ncbi:hypothetical protein Peur_039678 [Populus x canadensis]
MKYILKNLGQFLYAAEALGFKTYAPAYLSPEASGKNLLIGVNFASAASGYDDKTAFLNNAIPLPLQLKHFKEYQTKLVKVAGGRKAASIIKDALYILSAGTADFFQKYYVNPSVNKVYTPDQYSSYLATTFSSFVKPKTFSDIVEMTVSWVNTVARHFNKNLNLAADNLRKQLPGLKIVVFDIYKPLEDLVLSKQEEDAARRGLLGKYQYCAIQGCQELAPMPLSLCFGTVSILLRLLIRFLLMQFFFKVSHYLDEDK